MPFCFRVNYGLKVSCIIDCFELFIEKPSNLLTKVCTWSQYKHYNTAKYLICISPQGVITFISKGWVGRASDKHITEHSGFLKHLQHGDEILADRGFNVAKCLGSIGASLHIPSFTQGKTQLSPSEVQYRSFITSLLHACTRKETRHGYTKSTHRVCVDHVSCSV